MMEMVKKNYWKLPMKPFISSKIDQFDPTKVKSDVNNGSMFSEVTYELKWPMPLNIWKALVRWYKCIIFNQNLTKTLTSKILAFPGASPIQVWWKWTKGIELSIKYYILWKIFQTNVQKYSIM